MSIKVLPPIQEVEYVCDHCDTQVVIPQRLANGTDYMDIPLPPGWINVRGEYNKWSIQLLCSSCKTGVKG